MSIQKSEIELDVNGKPLNLYLASPSNGGPGILVLPSWWDLKPIFKQVCDRLAKQGYTALAPAYYQGRVANTIQEAETLQGEAEGDVAGFGALIKASKDKLVSLRPEKPIGVVGFSMGTDWSIVTAAREPDVAATVLFYGCYSVDFSKMKSAVQGHFAERDEYVPFERAQAMEKNLQTAGVEVTLYRYPGTAHWFMEPDRPEYDPASAELAWSRTEAFLRRTLK